jgi:hypothetical protein
MMPQPGPEGNPAYLPHEAYNLIGHQLFDDRWAERYSGQPLLPHLPMARKIVQQGGEAAKNLSALLQLGEHKYEDAQAQRYREAQAINALVEALTWGKAQAWTRQARGDWEPVFCAHWGSDAQLKRALLDDIAAYWRDATIPSGNILIDKPALDNWLPNVTPPNATSPVVASVPKEIGRKELPHKNALIAELRQRAVLLTSTKRGWRRRICRELQVWYAQQFPGDAVVNVGRSPGKQLMVKKPALSTLMKHLKSEFDEIQRSKLGAN